MNSIADLKKRTEYFAFMILHAMLFILAAWGMWKILIPIPNAGNFAGFAVCVLGLFLNWTRMLWNAVRWHDLLKDVGD